MVDLTLLMQQAAKGNQEAFGQLARQLNAYLFRLCYKWLNNEQLAEDAVQEVLIKLWKTAPKWQAQAEVKTFVYRIAYNHCLDILRQQKCVVELKDEHAVETKTEQKVYHGQQQAYLEQKLNELPENQRMAVVLFYYEEMKQTEIAKIMEISVKAVESLLSRAKKNLQQSVDPAYKEA